MADAPIKVLVSDKLAQEGVDVLEQAGGVEVDVKTGMDPEELVKVLPDYDAIIIRSATKLTADVLAKAPNLKAIARAGVGVDNIDIPAASKNGTIVMNTPGGNTTSTAELAVTLLLSMCRHIHPACQSLKEGRWDRKKYQGTEVDGKTVGVVGLGRIGCEVAKRCNAFNMRVMGYDPFVSEDRAASLGIELVREVKDLVPHVDFLTVHTPLNDDTRGIIGKAEFDAMKDGVRVVNNARGGIIDEEALLEALESGKVAGAALDVYMQEPPEDRRLVEHENVLCTPHLGASTEEAQITVAVDAANQIVDALRNGEVRFALNYPALSARDATELAPYGRLANRLGAFAGQMVDGQLKAVELIYAGALADRDLRSVTMQFTVGLMGCFEEAVNPVSAPMLARERGIDVRITNTDRADDFQSLITVKVETNEREHSVTGVIFGREDPRIVSVDGFQVEAVPQGVLLLMSNDDTPGVIGSVGTLLGENGINIGAMNWGRKAGSELAFSVVNVDVEDVGRDVLEKIRSINGVHEVRKVRI
jgi:D-3-phosphoglycerate dehydrogenase